MYYEAFRLMAKKKNNNSNFRFIYFIECIDFQTNLYKLQNNF